MSGRKYIGTIIFDKNIDQLSKSKKDSLKREIYLKMTSNEFFIKNISAGSGNHFSHKNKNIKLKGDKAFVHFKETMSPYSDSYQKKSKDKSLFNWAQKNFKKSMNFDRKMFLDDSLKAIKVRVKKVSRGGMRLEFEDGEEPEDTGKRGPGGGHVESYGTSGITGFIGEKELPVTNAPSWLKGLVLKKGSDTEKVEKGPLNRIKVKGIGKRIGKRKTTKASMKSKKEKKSRRGGKKSKKLKRNK